MSRHARSSILIVTPMEILKRFLAYKGLKLERLEAGHVTVNSWRATTDITSGGIQWVLVLEHDGARRYLPLRLPLQQKTPALAVNPAHSLHISKKRGRVHIIDFSDSFGTLKSGTTASAARLLILLSRFTTYRKGRGSMYRGSSKRSQSTTTEFRRQSTVIIRRRNTIAKYRNIRDCIRILI